MSVATPSAAAPNSRRRWPVGERAPDAGEVGEVGAFPPLRIWVAEFRLVVMTLPSLMYFLRCHNHCR